MPRRCTSSRRRVRAPRQRPSISAWPVRRAPGYAVGVANGDRATVDVQANRSECRAHRAVDPARQTPRSFPTGRCGRSSCRCARAARARRTPGAVLPISSGSQHVTAKARKMPVASTRASSRQCRSSRRMRRPRRRTALRCRQRPSAGSAGFYLTNATFVCRVGAYAFVGRDRNFLCVDLRRLLVRNAHRHRHQHDLGQEPAGCRCGRGAALALDTVFVLALAKMP